MRSHYCGNINSSDIGIDIEISGWVHKRRDHGGVIFLDIRDLHGIVQVVFNPDLKEIFEIADSCRSEYVVNINGKVRKRIEGAINPKMSTGEIEIEATSLTIFSSAVTPQFPLDDYQDVNEDIRLKYRFLDLRRPDVNQRLVQRSKITSEIRSFLERLGLDYKIVKAGSGAIGGDASEEFHVLAENGEDTIAVSDSSEFAINTELLLSEGENINSLQGKPSPDGIGTIEIKKGIEIGHIFQLGEIYADAMNANVLDNKGKSQTLYMGCYGIGISRLVAASIEQNHDDKGIIWPEVIAPFEVNIIAIGFGKDKMIAQAAIDIYNKLISMGYEVILDDRNDGFGTKMKDAELIGIPINIIIGKQYTEKNEIELRHRDGQSSIGMIDDIETIFEYFKKEDS